LKWKRKTIEGFSRFEKLFEWFVDMLRVKREFESFKDSLERIVKVQKQSRHLWNFEELSEANLSINIQSESIKTDPNPRANFKTN
jgi:hypothetical protein